MRVARQLPHWHSSPQHSIKLMREPCDAAVYSCMTRGGGHGNIISCCVEQVGALRQLESACVELTCGTHSMTQCHKKHTLTRAHACNNISVPPQAGDGVGPSVKLPPASANKRNTTRNTRSRATRHGEAHASHLNASVFRRTARHRTWRA